MQLPSLESADTLLGATTLSVLLVMTGTGAGGWVTCSERRGTGIMQCAHGVLWPACDNATDAHTRAASVLASWHQHAAWTHLILTPHTHREVGGCALHLPKRVGCRQPEHACHWATDVVGGDVIVRRARAERRRAARPR